MKNGEFFEAFIIFFGSIFSSLVVVLTISGLNTTGGLFSRPPSNSDTLHAVPS